MKPGDRSSTDTKLSKKLSYALRHGAEKLGLEMRDDGYVRISQLIMKRMFSDFSYDDIMRVIETNAKKRYMVLNEDGAQWVRATQGHSLPFVCEEKLLSVIKDPTLISNCVHGTFEKYVSLILKDGIMRMNRNHIHFIDEGREGGAIISGICRNAEVKIYVDHARAMQDGIRFFRSDNDVILSSGSEGVMLPRYITRAVRIRDDEELYVRGLTE